MSKVKRSNIEIKEDKYLKKIPNNDFEDLTNFQHSFIEDLTKKLNEWYKISDELMDEYLRLKNKMQNSTFSNEVIRELEQKRVESYLQEDKIISENLVHLEKFIRDKTKDEDSREWLYYEYTGKFSNLKDDLFLKLVSIYRDEFLYDMFIQTTFKNIITDDYEGFYYGFYDILKNAFDINHQTMSKYSIILTKLLFDKSVNLKKRPQQVKVAFSVFGYTHKYLRK